ncbi:MAG: S-adenosylmethionine decarboxylase [Trueperaceae bacterium]|nr:MAG: S-adenosylmethionine decarboxylase [Trueperaceae bacterium]
MESLAFGTHLIIDGFQADRRCLQGAEVLRAFLEQVIEKVDPHGPVQLESATMGTGRARGLTGVVFKAESHVTIHLYPETCRLSLDAFSHRAVHLSGLTTFLREHFQIGRFESHLRHRSKPLPTNRKHLLTTLSGDRMYAHLRLEDLLKE